VSAPLEPLDPREEFGEHGEWDALAVGWALSALDPADGELFAAHLQGCARCTATVRESLYTVADLAYALPDEAPPASMKTRLMAAVAAEPRTAAPVPPPAEHEEWPLGEPHPGTPGYNVDWFAEHQPPANDEPFPIHRPVAPSAPGPAASAPAPSSPDPAASAPGPAASAPGPVASAPAPLASSLEPPVLEPVAPEPVPARPDIRRADPGGRHAASGGRSDDGVVVPMQPRRRRYLSGVAAAAAVALIAALGGWNVQLRSDRNDLQQIAAQREAAIQQLTANEPARVAALINPKAPTEARKATLVVRGSQVEIIVETLGATPADQTYWLWTLNCDGGLAKAKDLKPVRGFTISQSAFSVRDIGSDADAASATCFAISSEPGTATPTVPTEVQAAGKPMQ
jgi:hypothetical protein